MLHVVLPVGELSGEELEWVWETGDLLVFVTLQLPIPRLMETEILRNAEILAQTTQNEIPGNGIVNSLFLKVQGEMNVYFEVRSKAYLWACVISDAKYKLMWTKHSSCNENGSATQNVICSTCCIWYILMAFLVEIAYRRVGCHELT